MLVRFSVSNFLSFKERTEFNMLPSGAQTAFKEHIYSNGDLRLLKTAAGYGANGAGKSNLIKAFAYLETVILEDKRNSLSPRKFKLDSSFNKAPTQFTVEFIRKGLSYIYFLELCDGIIIKESLHKTEVKKKDELLFVRVTSKGKTNIEFSKEYLKNAEDKERKKLYENEFLDEKKPLLSLLSNSKVARYKDVKNAFDWFKYDLIIIFPGAKPMVPIISEISAKANFKKFVDELIGSLDTGISQIEVQKYALTEFFGRDETKTIERIKKNLKRDNQAISLGKKDASEKIIAVLENGKPVIKRLINKHANKKGELFDFLVDEESDGTNRLLDLIPAFYGAIKEGSVVLVDEIEQSIHPVLLKGLINKFVSDNNTNGQLIFTTHESNLLDQEIFRRDEIWFFEKNSNGETCMYPLSDYEIRIDLDIRKGYLNGRFGAIPFLGNLKDLNWSKNE